MHRLATFISKPLGAIQTRIARKTLKMAAPLFAAAIVTLGPIAADAASRHCKGVYAWETTGGSIKGSFAQFEGRGTCGSAVPNRCRERARNAIGKCARVHWEKRWDREVPEACIYTGTNSTVKGYGLTLRCERLASAQKSACYVQGISQPSGSNAQTVMETIARKGDIKTRLEAEVCCAYKGGNHDFQNNRKVHVRLSYRSSGDNRCNRTETLSSDYKIDCQSFRQTYCAHQNLWD